MVGQPLTALPGAGAEDVSAQVTEPIERAIENVPGLETVQSSSGNSISLVFPLPLSYEARIRSIEGVSMVAWSNWFWGIYQNP